MSSLEKEVCELKDKLALFFERSYKDENEDGDGDWKEVYVIEVLEQMAVSLQGIDKSLAAIAKSGIPPRL